jgi:hypothetical protein
MSLAITVMTQTWYWRSTKDCQQFGSFHYGYGEAETFLVWYFFFGDFTLLSKALTSSPFAFSYYRQQPLIFSPNSVVMVLSRLFPPRSRALLPILVHGIVFSIMRSSSL